MIPDFQTIMLPLLKTISDGKEYSSNEMTDSLARQFKLSQEEINQYFPSGSAKTFSNRVGWAKSYLKMAGLLEYPRRAMVRISDSGIDFLKKNPTEITLKVLRAIPAFMESFNNTKREGESNDANDNHDLISTPEELLEGSYLTIRKNLAQELLQRIKSCSPAFFENLVVELLVKMGYGGSIQDAGQSIGQSGDEGIDGIIKEDRLGLDVIYIQAKRWENVVGRPEIQKFVGALAGQGAKKGVFITTSRFTNDARMYQPRNETKIVLIDGEKLADLMIDFNLAVTVTNTFEIKRIDSDYFEE